MVFIDFRHLVELTFILACIAAVLLFVLAPPSVSMSDRIKAGWHGFLFAFAMLCVAIVMTSF